MRQDQFEKLTQLSERLADQALVDADPDNWIGAGKTAAIMTSAERGDALWCRKVGTQTIALLCRVVNLTDAIRQASNTNPGGGGAAVTDPEEERERMLKEAEGEADRLIREVQKKLKDRSANAG